MAFVSFPSYAIDLNGYRIKNSFRFRLYNFCVFLMVLFSSSIIVTGISTFLISHRILSTTSQNPSITSLAPYRKIQRIVIESGVAYSMGMLVTGIAIVFYYTLPKASPPHSVVVIIDKTCVFLTYSQALLTPLSVCFILFIFRNL